MHRVEVGQGENVVFLHGWGGDVSAFLFAAKCLNDRFRGVLFDMYGFGLTPEPNKPLTVMDYASGVVDEMEKANISSAAFVCHSFGGRVGMEIAAKYPEKVKCLILVDSAGIKPHRKPSYYLKIFLHKLLVSCGFSGLKGSREYQVLSPVMKETFKRVVNYNQQYLLERIKCPTAIFWGRNDTDTPPYMAKKLKNGIKGSEIFWLNGGHFAYLEDDFTFIAVLTAFLDNTLYGRRAKL